MKRRVEIQTGRTGGQVRTRGQVRTGGQVSGVEAGGGQAGCLEAVHRQFDAAHQLPGPQYVARHWGRIPHDEWPTLLLLVEQLDRLQIEPVVVENYLLEALASGAHTPHEHATHALLTQLIARIAAATM